MTKPCPCDPAIGENCPECYVAVPSLAERLEASAQRIRNDYGSWVAHAVTAMTVAAIELRRLESGNARLREALETCFSALTAVEAATCEDCGHADYHCIASGCNHEGCDCEEFEGDEPDPWPLVQAVHNARAALATPSGQKEAER